MPASKAYQELFAAGTNVPTAKTKADPVASVAVDLRLAYGGEITWRITNDGALGAGCAIQPQVSQDGIDWYDYCIPVMSQDLLSGTVTQGHAIKISKDVMYLRLLAYGNTTNTCKVQAGIQATTAL